MQSQRHLQPIKLWEDTAQTRQGLDTLNADSDESRHISDLSSQMLCSSNLHQTIQASDKTVLSLYEIKTGTQEPGSSSQSPTHPQMMNHRAIPITTTDVILDIPETDSPEISDDDHLDSSETDSPEASTLHPTQPTELR